MGKGIPKASTNSGIGTGNFCPKLALEDIQTLL